MATPATAAQIHEEIQRAFAQRYRDGDSEIAGADATRANARLRQHWAVDVLPDSRRLPAVVGNRARRDGEYNCANRRGKTMYTRAA